MPPLLTSLEMFPVVMIASKHVFGLSFWLDGEDGDVFNLELRGPWMSCARMTENCRPSFNSVIMISAGPIVERLRKSTWNVTTSGWFKDLWQVCKCCRTVSAANDAR